VFTNLDSKQEDIRF